MPIHSPTGPLVTLEELVFQARGKREELEAHFVSPVLLVVAPTESWAGVARQTVEIPLASVHMLPTLVITLTGEGEVSFGRSSDSGLALPFAAVSKEHGCFRQEGEGWLVCDSGSKNGTVVDGVRVVNGECVPLRDGALLRFGDVTAKFLLPKSFCSDLRRRISS